MLTRLLDRIERAESLDPAVDRARDAVGPVVTGDATGPLLGGDWLGHALHPLATDAVIGPWLAAAVLDLTGGSGARPAARRLIGVGILAALPTAASGAHDWVGDDAPAVRRTGLVHAAANTVGLGLQCASWLARRRGRHGRGVALSAAALTAVGAGGYLGGHLSYALGAGVDRGALAARA